MALHPLIERLEASVFTIPTDGPEADGTLTWDRTTILVVRAASGGIWGCGYSYTDAAGLLGPDLGRPGHGLVLRQREAARYAA